MIMNWLHTQWSATQLHWVHEISQSALALAVALLGVVMLLELATIARLRRSVDAQMQRLLQQIELLRGERSQPPDTQQARANAAVPSAATAAARATGDAVAAPYAPPALGAGEARLLAALTAARARLERPGSKANAA